METNRYQAPREIIEPLSGQPRDWAPLVLTVVNIVTLAVVLLVLLAILLPASQVTQ